MQLYKLIFHSVPVISFAHRYSTNHYHIQFPPRSNLFEITCIEKGDVLLKTADGAVTDFIAPCIHMFMTQKKSCILSSIAPIHQHLTIGIQADFTLIPVTTDDILLDYQKPMQNSKKLFAYITPYINDTSVLDDIRAIISRIILNSHSHLENISNQADLMTILAISNRYCIDSALRNQNKDFSYGEILYCRKTIDYIMKNIHKKICIDDIANMLNISSAHLSRIFKHIMNTTIIQYSNQQKINYVKELLDTKNISNSELVELIGFSDEKYLSRMFKKYTHMTITEYKQTSIYVE